MDSDFRCADQLTSPLNRCPKRLEVRARLLAGIERRFLNGLPAHHIKDCLLWHPRERMRIAQLLGIDIGGKPAFEQGHF